MIFFFKKKVQNDPDKQKRLSYGVFHRFRILCFKFHKGVLSTSINIDHMTLSYNQSRVLILVIRL
jgi:hypothetical protein